MMLISAMVLQRASSRTSWPPSPGTLPPSWASFNGLEVNGRERSIRDRLVEQGWALFKAPRKELIRFTGVLEADMLLNDLEHHPHAFVLACVMDRQIKAEKAWLIPYYIAKRLGGEFSMEALSQLSVEDTVRLMREPEPLHRFVNQMSTLFHLAVQHLMNKYRGNAALIWYDRPSSAMVIYRFLGFKGVGPKIASMAANILARKFKIPLSDYFSIDISPDIHVRRVFARLGLCPENPTAEQVIYKARALYPEFPGIMDEPCWRIGRNWCKPRAPKCEDCYMNDLCPTASHLQGWEKDHQGRR